MSTTKTTSQYDVLSLKVSNTSFKSNFASIDENLSSISLNVPKPSKSTRSVHNYIHVQKISLLDFKFLFITIILPICISIIIIQLILIFQSRSINKIDIIETHFSLDPNQLNCHKNAVPHYSTYFKRYHCVCKSTYTGDGRTVCDPCGAVRKTNAIRIVGGVEAIASSWPMAVFFEQTYKHTYLINKTLHPVKKVRNLQTHFKLVYQ